jgi:hypothetical protein
MKTTTGHRKELSPERREELLGGLKTRFEKNMNRHKGLGWPEVKARLEARAEKLWSLNEMERTGGDHTDLYDKVDVIPFDKLTSFFNQHLSV